MSADSLTPEDIYTFVRRVASQYGAGAEPLEVVISLTSGLKVELPIPGVIDPTDVPMDERIVAALEGGAELKGTVLARRCGVKYTNGHFKGTLKQLIDDGEVERTDRHTYRLTGGTGHQRLSEITGYRGRPSAS